MKRTVTLLLVLVIGVAMLMSCGGGKGLTGKYKLVSLVLDGEELFTMFKEAGTDMDSMYIEFLSAKDYKISVVDEYGDGTYKLNGNKLTLTNSDGEKMDGTADANKVVLEYVESGVNFRMEFVK